MNILFYKKLKNNLNNFSQKPKLLAVTKYSNIDEINNAIKNWINLIWENRLEIAQEKFKNLNYDVEKHYIWIVQTKKLKKIFQIFDVIESIWNMKQLLKINQIAKNEWKIANIFLQFNISNEAQKSWFKKENIDEILKEYKSLNCVNILWIMWMASKSQKNEIKKQFLLANEIFKKLKNEIKSIKELSIWMSNDYEIALECWATIVRVWSALFK